jgi:hypothetical protein
MSNRVSQGKGSRNRSHGKKFTSNYDSINWNNKQSKSQQRRIALQELTDYDQEIKL